MADFSIDYSALHRAQEQMKSLANTAESGGATGEFKTVGESTPSERRAVFGSTELGTAFNRFYENSAKRAKEAKDGLNELAEIFASVSNVFFEADAQLAGGSGVTSQALGISNWRNSKAQWDAWDSATEEWNDYLEEIGAKEYFDANPDADIGQVCRADSPPEFCETWREDTDAPSPPGDKPDGERPSDEPPTEFTFEDENGVTNVKVELDDDYNIMKETTEVTTTDGQSFTSETVYETSPQYVTKDGVTFDARDFTTTTTYADGTTITSEVTIEEDGSGVMTSTDGDGEVTRYTRSGPGDEWEEDD